MTMSPDPDMSNRPELNTLIAPARSISARSTEGIVLAGAGTASGTIVVNRSRRLSNCSRTAGNCCAGAWSSTLTCRPG